MARPDDVSDWSLHDQDNEGYDIDQYGRRRNEDLQDFEERMSHSIDDNIHDVYTGDFHDNWGDDHDDSHDPWRGRKIPVE